jgi:hypothetical protein
MPSDQQGEDTMSKSVTRIAFVLLLTLILVVGAYTVVYGAAFNAGARSGTLHTTAGLLLDQSHTRSAAVDLNTYSADTQQPAKVHDCEFDARVDPDD